MEARHFSISSVAKVMRFFRPERANSQHYAKMFGAAVEKHRGLMALCIAPHTPSSTEGGVPIEPMGQSLCLLWMHSNGQTGVERLRV